RGSRHRQLAARARGVPARRGGRRRQGHGCALARRRAGSRQDVTDQRPEEDAMPTAMVNGLKIAYELHGDGEPVAITPGGRFSMDTKGVRELAQALVAGGKKALIWDRPNTGASDICLDAEFESSMHADTLAGLIQTLELGKTAI